MQRHLNRRQLIGAIGGATFATRMWLHSTSARHGEIVRGGVPLVALPWLPGRPLDLSDTRWETAWLRSLVFDAPLRAGTTGGIVAGAGIPYGFGPDATTFDIAARTGVLFADGRPLTAGDIAGSIERARNSASPSETWRWAHVDRVAVSDGGSVRIHLRQPDMTIPATLASSLIPVTAGDPGESGTAVAGTGPFVLASGDAGEYRFRANRAHWTAGQPRFDGCTVLAVEGSIERTSRLVTGRVDAVPDVPLLDIPLLDNDPGVVLISGPTRRLGVLALTVTREPLNDVRVRRLIASAIDRDALVDGATAGTAEPAWSLFPPDHWAGSPEIERPSPSDSAVIRESLADLGLPPGWHLRLACPVDLPALPNTAVLLQEQLAEAGIALGIDLLDRAAMDEAGRSAAYDLTLAYTPEWLDPHEIAFPLLHSNGASNVSGLSDDRVDRLLAKARATTSQPDRGRYYAGVERIVLDQIPIVPLFWPPRVTGIRARIDAWSRHWPPSGRGLASGWFPRP